MRSNVRELVSQRFISRYEIEREYSQDLKDHILETMKREHGFALLKEILESESPIVVDLRMEETQDLEGYVWKFRSRLSAVNKMEIYTPIFVEKTVELPIFKYSENKFKKKIQQFCVWLIKLTGDKSA